MNLLTQLLLAFILLSSQAAFGHTAFGNDMSLQKTERLTLAATQLTTFKINAGSGKMIVTAQDRDDVEVVAQVYQKIAHDDYCLNLDKSKDTAILNSSNCAHNQATRIDLTIIVPQHLALDINDGSGAIKITGGASLQLKDGSGSITINDVRGMVKINDGSGSININHINNDVFIKDGSGSITANNITGKVTVSDGSGSINVNKAHSFELLSDGSGSVNIDNISGEVIMDH